MAEVHAKGHSFRLCNTYRPEWTDSEYWARLNHAIGLAYQVNENIVISDLMSLNNNKLIDMMKLFNFKHVIDKPTRVTNHSRTLLDAIIVNDTINYVFSDVFKLPILLNVLRENIFNTCMFFNILLYGQINKKLYACVTSTCICI
jgi:hypothetical protein